MIQFIIKEDEKGLFYIEKDFSQSNQTNEYTSSLEILDIVGRDEAVRLAHQLADKETEQTWVS